MTIVATLPSKTDADAGMEWMRRVARGEHEASRHLVDQHLAPITRFAFRLLGDASEAEDVAQETFLRLWRQAPRWEPRAKVSTWLFRVAHNLCIDRLRARREVPVTDLPEREDPRPSASTQLEGHQASKAVNEAIAALPERQRTALALVYYQGFSAQEAAEVLGVHVDGVESLLARARRNLRKQLQLQELASKPDAS